MFGGGESLTGFIFIFYRAKRTPTVPVTIALAQDHIPAGHQSPDRSSPIPIDIQTPADSATWNNSNSMEFEFDSSNQGLLQTVQSTPTVTTTTSHLSPSSDISDEDVIEIDQN